jgi:hypothetical protein
MSHKATLWAIEQRGLKPTTKIVLWHLCDRFNPDFGCFPSQARLTQDCEISRSAPNHHLDRLETAKLLRRVPRIDPVTRRQMPTRYILEFEEGFLPQEPEPQPEPCPDSGHGSESYEDAGAEAAEANSDAANPTEPCPDFASSRVRILSKAVSGIRTLTL